ncbi:MAG: MarR family winged helix-turn-helix transcriptional regulator [Caulobacterales bacterium]
MHGEAAPRPTEADEPLRLRLGEHLPHTLRQSADAVSRLIARAYEDRFSLSIPEWRLMAWLAECGPASEAKIAAAMPDAVTARRAAEALTIRGAAQRTAAGLALTEAGQHLYDEIAPLVLAYEAALLTGLSPGEVTALKHLLKRVHAAADRLRGPAP